MSPTLQTRDARLILQSVRDHISSDCACGGPDSGKLLWDKDTRIKCVIITLVCEEEVLAEAICEWNASKQANRIN